MTVTLSTNVIVVLFCIISLLIVDAYLRKQRSVFFVDEFMGINCEVLNASCGLKHEIF